MQIPVTPVMATKHPMAMALPRRRAAKSVVGKKKGWRGAYHSTKIGVSFNADGSFITNMTPHAVIAKPASMMMSAVNRTK